MNEKKMYAVKSNEGKYWDFGYLGGSWQWELDLCNSVTISEDFAKDIVKEHGGNVIAFVEKPEVVKLSEKQAKVVENAHKRTLPATYISAKSEDDEEELFMSAYVNGYEIIDNKKYLVFERLGGKQNKQKIKPAAQAYHSAFYKDTVLWSIEDQESLSVLPRTQFTEEEIERYGLKGYERVEVDMECKNGK